MEIKKMPLSPRLQSLYDVLRPGMPVWDVCCDHGLLGSAAVESGRFPHVHFVDQVSPLIEQLQQKYYLKKHLSFWPLAAEKLDQVVDGNMVIAGVGSHTILRVLEGLRSRGKLQAQRIILCPQRDDNVLDEKIKSRLQDYRVTRKSKIIERHRTRTIFILDRLAQASS